MKSVVKSNTTSIELAGYTITTTDYYILFDKQYESREIWENYPRGLTEITFKKGDSLIKTFKLSGIRKFGYYSEFNHNNIFLESESDTELKEDRIEFYTEKENGECFHIKSVKVENEQFWIGGSKNVHAVFRNESDILLYKNLKKCSSGVQKEGREGAPRPYTYEIGGPPPSRFGFFEEMCLEFIKLDTKQLSDFLIKFNLTAVAEFCSSNHQHIVNYFDSNLQPFCHFKFFAFSSDLPSDIGIIYYDPLKTKEIIESFGLSGVKEIYKVRTMEEREKVRNYFRRKENSEGAVVYILDSDKISYMYKYKNDVYAFKRAVREKIRSKSRPEEIINRIKNLHFTLDPSDETRLTNEMLQFNAYLREKGETNLEKWVEEYSKFTKKSEKEKEEILENFYKKEKEGELIFITVGIPGIGKSTLTEILQRILKGKRINQDEIKGSQKFKKKEFIKQLTENTKFPLFIDKTNINSNIREDYNCLNGRKIYLLFDLEDKNELLQLSMNRIRKRKTSHYSLYPTDNLQKILKGFIHSFENLNKSNEIIQISPLDSLFNQTKTVLDYLKYPYQKEKIENEISKTLNEFQNNKNKKLKTKYWSISFDYDSIFSLIPKISFDEKFTIKDEFHSTLIYNNLKFKDFFENCDKDYLKLEGLEVKVELVDLIIDKFGVCIYINILDQKLFMDDIYSHITIGFDNEIVDAVYSKQIVKKYLENENLKIIPIKKEITGVITRNF